mgnify:FL=1
MEERKLVKTADGSHTLYFSELDEHYHSTKGAIQESVHVFIKNGYEYLSKMEEIHILEIGFGTGLNALLTLRESRNSVKQLKYTAIEKYPLPPEMVNKLNYGQQLSGTSSNELLDLHKASWEEWHKLSSHFMFRKLKTDLRIFQPDDNFELIYFDAFAPDKQPDMWSEGIFKRMYEYLSVGGILVTYSAKGLIKRRLKSIGFRVENLPGPPGKREMIRAIKE